jgi:hypothetical protein
LRGRTKLVDQTIAPGVVLTHPECPNAAHCRGDPGITAHHEGVHSAAAVPTAERGARIVRRFTSRLGLAIGTAALFLCLSAGSLLAGEVKGPPGGELPDTPIGAAPDDDPHANSICSFSGLGDGEDEPGRTAEHVQNWGQIPKLGPGGRDELSTLGFHPGDSCNGHSGFFSGGE